MNRYILFFAHGKDIAHGGIRVGSFDVLRQSFPNAAIVEQYPENWWELSVRNSELVPATVDELEFREQINNQSNDND